ncbi:Golgi to ER traffic- protein [Puccinia graminis f. sp. tritici]|uniref:Golgi to ER traffic-protein n=1 Tax=Puccinia graminis f. sp. tritici TaxID=56615 RepID=A0A5B0RAE0_PUCGR|nr:Golgi to ER traffic- protein [Puccinia graminis f. sp. tritici]
MRNQAAGLGVAHKTKPKPKGSEPVPAASDWATVPMKRLPKAASRALDPILPKIVQKTGRVIPTADDFRKTERDGAELDPALSDVDNGSAEDDEVSDSLTARGNGLTKQKGTVNKPTTISASDRKASGSAKAKSTPKVVIQKLVDGRVRRPDSVGGQPKAGQGLNAKLIAEALARHEAATSGVDSPENMIAVGNGELMTLDECRSFLHRFPSLTPGGGASPARAPSTGPSKGPEAARSTSSPVIPPPGKTADGLPEFPSIHRPLKDPKPFLIGQTLGDLTPLHKGMMTRTPSTTSSINNGMLPNLGTASLDQLKSMRRICMKTKDMLSTSVSEIRAEELHLMAPGAYGFQDRHLRLMTRYCSQLDSKIAEAEKAGVSDSIEVIDLTMDDADDNQASTSTKRPSRPTDGSAFDDSPVLAKKSRISRKFVPNLPPYSFRDIPDRDLLAGIAPRFPVNRQPSISEFTSQFHAPLTLPNIPKRPGGGTDVSSGLTPLNQSNNVVQGSTGEQDSNLPVGVHTSGSKSSSKSSTALSGLGDRHKAPHPTSRPTTLSSVPSGNSSTAAVEALSNGNRSKDPTTTRLTTLSSVTSGNSSTTAAEGLANGIRSKDPTGVASTKKTSGPGAIHTSGTSLPSSSTAPVDGLASGNLRKGPTGESAPNQSSGDIEMGDPVRNDVETGGVDVNTEATNTAEGKGHKQTADVVGEPDPTKKLRGKGIDATTKKTVTKESMAPKQTADDQQVGAELRTGADLDDVNKDDGPDAPKKVRGKGKGFGQANAKEKAAKTTKKKLADMTPEEKAARVEERKEKAKARKEEKANCVHAIPPQPGNLLAPMWTAKECEDARRAHKKMLIDSRNPQWDFGPELMDLVADMVLAFKKDVQTDDFYTKSPQFTPEAHMVDAIQEVFEGDFPGLIMKCRCRGSILDRGSGKFVYYQKAHDSKDSVKAASWITLYGMMLRVDHYADYTEDTNTVKLFEGAFRKLHTLTVSSFNEFHRYVLPSEKPVDKSIPSFKQDTALQAGRFVINKIKSLKVGAATAAHHGNARTGNGLMLLQKRIWDTLLCVLMMQQSLFQQDLEHCIQTGTYPNQTMLVSQHMSANQRAQSLYKHGDVKDTKNAKAMKEWGEDRLAAFGSMAIFFLYGAAGWWQFLTDSHHYNQKDVWVLVHLAKGKSDWIYKNGHLIKRRPEDTPWYRIDSFVRWLLVKTNMHVRISDKVDWEAAPKFWAEHVTSHNIARLALQDVLSEVCMDSPLKSLNFNGEPAPDVELDEDVVASVDKCRAKLTAGWQGLIEGTTGIDLADGPAEGSGGSSGLDEDEEEEEEESFSSEEEVESAPAPRRKPRPSGKPLRGTILSSASSGFGSDDSRRKEGDEDDELSDPDEEDDDSATDIHRSDSDGGVEERERRRHEHPFINYTSKVERSR